MMDDSDIILEIRMLYEARLRVSIKKEVYDWIYSHTNNLTYIKNNEFLEEDSKIVSYCKYNKASSIMHLLRDMDSVHTADVHSNMVMVYGISYIREMTFRKVIDLYVDKLMMRFDLQ